MLGLEQMPFHSNRPSHDAAGNSNHISTLPCGRSIKSTECITTSVSSPCRKQRAELLKLQRLRQELIHATFIRSGSILGPRESRKCYDNCSRLMTLLLQFSYASGRLEPIHFRPGDVHHHHAKSLLSPLWCLHRKESPFCCLDILVHPLRLPIRPQQPRVDVIIFDEQNC